MCVRAAPLLFALCLATCALAVETPVYTYGNRPIDLLPKSHVPQPEDAAGWATPEVTQPLLALHLKDLFRAGSAGLERLCVVEAALPRAAAPAPARLLLTAPHEQIVWQQTAGWLGPTVRMRPYWLPVTATATVLVLTGEAGGYARCEAALAAGAPAALLDLRLPDEPLAVDAGFALPAADDLLLRPDTRQAVLRLALREPLSAAAQVRVRLLPAAAAGSPTASVSLSPERPCLQEGRLLLPALQAGARYRLSLEVSYTGQRLLRRSYAICVVPAAPEPGFGARAADLRFTSPVSDGDTEHRWDELWARSGKRDVVVTLPGRRARLVFWRGASYVPCWALPEAWLTYEWLEAEPYFFGADDCVEPLQDRDCKYSEARIVSSTPARAVVSWRYSLTDFQNRIIRGEHAEEIFTVYPDGVGTRYLRGFYESGWHENQEFIVVNRPGRWPSQALQPQALTFYDLTGRKQAPVWPKPGFSLEGWGHVVTLVNTTAGPRPFMVTPGAPEQVKVWADPYTEKPDLFNSYPHWPVTRGLRTSWLSDPRDFRRPTHSNLANLVNPPVREAGPEHDFLWLIGVADEDAAAVEAGACWAKPGNIRPETGVTAGEYSAAERAYLITRGDGAVCRFTLTPSPGTPVVNPAFVVRPWRGPATVSVAGAHEVQTGLESDRLVVWARGTLAAPAVVEVRPRR